MQKVITFNPNKCTGCRTCELACSTSHTNTCNPSRSRIRILKMGEYLHIPIRCRQCEDPVCIRICPFRALTRNEEVGFIEINNNVCVGCKLCVEYCPFGGSQLDFVERKITMCDLCDGDPQCVKLCSAGALEYVELEEMVLKRRDELFRIYMEFMKTGKIEKF